MQLACPTHKREPHMHTPTQPPHPSVPHLPARPPPPPAGYLITNGLMPVRTLLSAIGFTYSLVFATQGALQSFTDCRQVRGRQGGGGSVAACTHAAAEGPLLGLGQ